METFSVNVFCDFPAFTTRFFCVNASYATLAIFTRMVLPTDYGQILTDTGSDRTRNG